LLPAFLSEKPMMNGLRVASSLGLLAAGHAMSASSSDFAGRWELTTVFPGGSYVAGLNLMTDGSGYKGRGGYLVPGGIFPFRYVGIEQKNGLHLQILASDGTTAIGDLVLRLKAGVLSGGGKLHEIPITVTGRRPLVHPTGAPTAHTFDPQVYYGTFSGTNPPALHLFPGDTVRTKTVDAYGNDENGVHRTLAGNAQTGPFYIEGAMVGDTIAVHFNKIRPNRDTAIQFRGALNPNVLPASYQQQPAAGWSNIWKLDRAHGTATPDLPSEKLKGLTIKLAPMLGCVAVAPYQFESSNTAHLGPYGGNMDYREVQEGSTLYMPVYQAGALLSVGDGHAAQGDGEITGQGLETSMDVEFSVDLIRDQLLDQPWAENDEYIMVSGIGRSLPDALQLASAGLANWLKSYYRLDMAEIATVLANSIHYDIAEVVDPEFHVVAKIKKEMLKQIPKPESPSTMFCQAPWGCAPN
jgi:amidase